MASHKGEKRLAKHSEAVNLKPKKDRQTMSDGTDGAPREITTCIGTPAQQQKHFLMESKRVLSPYFSTRMAQRSR